jgi:hypothetical protein
MADTAGETVELPHGYHVKSALVSIGHETVEFRPSILRPADSRVDVFSSDSPSPPLAVFA